MTTLELLAPARNKDIGIAAIDCGADAVYIAGPAFGARQAAGNRIEDIQELCQYAHRFGAKIFVTLNTILYDSELDSAYRQMEAVQNAGADALIVQDLSLLGMAESFHHFGKDFSIPLHASTQCAIRTSEQAVFLENLGFSRLILERELSLDDIRRISESVNCELEFFVHGALCVCYSGQCYLSEMIDGRSANRGACMQACRSRYDLTDHTGKILCKDTPLLSLKDFNLIGSIGKLAENGIQSFKIEGRLKNISYVRNTVRAYSEAIDKFISAHPDRYCRASFGHVESNIRPDLNKTFNRGYTSLFIDGKRGKWASEGSTKSMGEELGNVSSIKRQGKGNAILQVSFKDQNIRLNNGDGFSFVGKDGKVRGFRGDICSGNTITCKFTEDLYRGCRLFRNIDTAFEKELEKSIAKREINVRTSLSIRKDNGEFIITANSLTEDGREHSADFNAGNTPARNPERSIDMLRQQIGKSTDGLCFTVCDIVYDTEIPFVTAAFMNGIRRTIAEEISAMPVQDHKLLNRNSEILGRDCHFGDTTYKQNISNRISEKIYRKCGAGHIQKAYELTHDKDAELMRSKYCIRYELGICPKYHHAKPTGPLFLSNNGMKLSIHFDCAACEMIIRKA